MNKAFSVISLRKYDAVFLEYVDVDLVLVCTNRPTQTHPTPQGGRGSPLLVFLRGGGLALRPGPYMDHESHARN